MCEDDGTEGEGGILCNLSVSDHSFARSPAFVMSFFALFVFYEVY